MLAPITSYKTQLGPVPGSKSRLLLVTDSQERLKALKAGLADANFEITCAGSVDELRDACNNHHDLVILDVDSAQIRTLLSTLRTNAGHKTIMTLVESSRLGEENNNLSGLLPSFHAMACSRTEITTLARLFGNSRKPPTSNRPALL